MGIDRRIQELAWRFVGQIWEYLSIRINNDNGLNLLWNKIMNTYIFDIEINILINGREGKVLSLDCQLRNVGGMTGRT